MKILSFAPVTQGIAGFTKMAMVSVSIVLAGVSAQASGSKPIIEQHLVTFGSPIEFKSECINMKDFGFVKTCVEWKVKNLQHKFVLELHGPNPEDAIKAVLKDAVAASVVAAVGSSLGTPSPEPSARIAAALAAAKTTFVAYLAANGLDRLITEYDLEIDHSTYW